MIRNNMNKELISGIQTILIMIGVAVFMLLQAIILDVWTIDKGFIINVTATIMWAMEWVLMTFGIVYFMNKNKYDKNEKENKELKEMISLDVQNFFINRGDFRDRMAYLKRCLEFYRVHDSRRILEEKISEEKRK
jgi:hypothetical protein